MTNRLLGKNKYVKIFSRRFYSSVRSPNKRFQRYNNFYPAEGSAEEFKLWLKFGAGGQFVYMLVWLGMAYRKFQENEIEKLLKYSNEDTFNTRTNQISTQVYQNYFTLRGFNLNYFTLQGLNFNFSSIKDIFLSFFPKLHFNITNYANYPKRINNNFHFLNLRKDKYVQNSILKTYKPNFSNPIRLYSTLHTIKAEIPFQPICENNNNNNNNYSSTNITNTLSPISHLTSNFKINTDTKNTFLISNNIILSKGVEISISIINKFHRKFNSKKIKDELKENKIRELANYLQALGIIQNEFYNLLKENSKNCKKDKNQDVQFYKFLSGTLRYNSFKKIEKSFKNISISKGIMDSLPKFNNSTFDLIDSQIDNLGNINHSLNSTFTNVDFAKKLLVNIKGKNIIHHNRPSFYLNSDPRDDFNNISKIFLFPRHGQLIELGEELLNLNSLPSEKLLEIILSGLVKNLQNAAACIVFEQFVEMNIDPNPKSVALYIKSLSTSSNSLHYLSKYKSLIASCFMEKNHNSGSCVISSKYSSQHSTTEDPYEKNRLLVLRALVKNYTFHNQFQDIKKLFSQLTTNFQNNSNSHLDNTLLQYFIQAFKKSNTHCRAELYIAWKLIDARLNFGIEKPTKLLLKELHDAFMGINDLPSAEKVINYGKKRLSYSRSEILCALRKPLNLNITQSSDAKYTFDRKLSRLHYIKMLHCQSHRKKAVRFSEKTIGILLSDSRKRRLLLNNLPLMMKYYRQTHELK